ncbi:hypothetical protein AMAG_20521 [Allomyces macrogynus ATCC 38327]|uniref:Uncharacterized protein n=1 Tax=Allomyces macrogynus (strain ATCC 38327) TaxID=578462 RepID=A0A0L0TC94_ALLM3|nr:hypothetical protein AMAG_20521 [Allomyces macrogynus ATCC 38327]|eukprot:KNE72438.1 hypothetical protein AMAG_20521 [Allomyces macrogynus ATCC 38327]
MPSKPSAPKKPGSSLAAALSFLDSTKPVDLDPESAAFRGSDDDNDSDDERDRSHYAAVGKSALRAAVAAPIDEHGKYAGRSVSRKAVFSDASDDVDDEDDGEDDEEEKPPVMWAQTNPFVKDAKEKKPKEAVFKCLTIMDVWQSNRGLKKTILRNSPKSKGAKRDSTNMDVETLLIINTGTRQLHLRAPTPEDHEAWFQGLSFLVDERRKAQVLPHDTDEKAAAALANAGARPPTQFKAAATA